MGVDKSHYSADGRVDVWNIPPEKITVVTDKSHPLYDERVDLPLDEATVLNIMVFGVTNHVLVRRNGERNGVPLIEVIDGRQRVRCAVEANKRLRKMGSPTICVPCFARKGDDALNYGVMISANEHRRGDLPMVKARKLQKYMSFGKTIEEAANVAKLTVQATKNLIDLLDLHPKLQAKIDSYDLSATTARELGKLPQDEQVAAYQKLVDAGATKGDAAVEAARDVAAGRPVKPKTQRTKVRSRVLLGKLRDEVSCYDTKEAKIATALVEWFLGNDRALADFPSLHEAVKAVRKVTKRSSKKQEAA